MTMIGADLIGKKHITIWGFGILLEESGPPSCMEPQPSNVSEQFSLS